MSAGPELWSSRAHAARHLSSTEVGGGSKHSTTALPREVTSKRNSGTNLRYGRMRAVCERVSVAVEVVEAGEVLRHGLRSMSPESVSSPRSGGGPSKTPLGLERKRYLPSRRLQERRRGADAEHHGHSAPGIGRRHLQLETVPNKGRGEELGWPEEAIVDPLRSNRPDSDEGCPGRRTVDLPRGLENSAELRFGRTIEARGWPRGY